MASDQGDNEAEQQETHEPRECMACRGSGRVISNLGGTASEVACPWCDGSGVRAAGIDAQAHWPANEAPATGPGPAGEPADSRASGDAADEGAQGGDGPPADAA